jgi:hypothetical protein
MKKIKVGIAIVLSAVAVAAWAGVVSNPAVILGTTSTDTLTITGLTASRLVVSDAAKALASNGAITTGAYTKSVSSGATLAASLCSDDATNTTCGPLLNKKVITVNTGAGTVTTAALSGTVYTNTGDADGSSLVLLNDPTIGVYYDFLNTVAQLVTITPSAGETLYLGNDQCVTSITKTSIGTSVRIVAATGGSGAIWVASGDTAAGLTCNG